MGLIDRLRRRYEASRLHQLRLLLQDSDAIRGNVKNFGYQLARDAVERRGEVDVSAEPQRRGLVSKPTTQADMESAWFAYWCSQVKAAPIYHRKLWEFAFALQVLHDQGLLREGARGIGFGCGEEPLASYFASKSMDVLVTDLDSTQVAGQGWTETGQHAGTLESAFFPDIVDRARFARHVTHRFVDMNAIPRFDAPFDFCWSICAMEHLGDIERGLRFVENSMSVLKPGGVAIHTTEFNFNGADRTVSEGPTVLYLRRHFEDLEKRLAAQGCRMLGPDFSVGTGPLDRFVDIPPYAFGEGGWFNMKTWTSREQAAHLKLLVFGYPSTCFGIVAVKDMPGR